MHVIVASLFAVYADDDDDDDDGGDFCAGLPLDYAPRTQCFPMDGDDFNRVVLQGRERERE